MRKRMQNQIKRGRKAGIPPADMLHMRAIAEKEAKKMEQRATEEAFICMMAIPLNVLAHDYWPKSAKKKIPEFAYKVLGLYEAVQAGVVTQQELIDLLKEYGINMKEGENNEHTKCKRKKS